MTTILITGSTDGIGLEAAKKFAAAGHDVALHGRSHDKLAVAQAAVANVSSHGRPIKQFVADLSRPTDVAVFAAQVVEQFDSLDVLINNAGVFKTPHPITSDGLDVRFSVNTIAPYLFTRRVLPLLAASGRVINLSSAAQAPVDLDALAGKRNLDANTAYAQSKLAITMWSRHMADELDGGPAVIAVNPGSLLATKMVKEGYGMDGKDINIGSDILMRAALSDEFASASGQYFDNDAGRFAPPHPDALDPQKNQRVVAAVESIINDLT